MIWTPAQQKRLEKELELLHIYFPSFKPRYLFQQILLEGWMTTNLKNRYLIRLYVPADMPNSIPEVVITYPGSLTDYHGKKLSDYQQDMHMHLLKPRDGFPSLCTFKPSHWHPNLTFYNVLIKARMWLEAYEGHRISGKPIDYYLKHQY
ncbi:MAG: hypothetical protein KatS3mg031_2691 [Chitinophagales bacterium]|nr:MAG: hypothetical protein KatS3mg031_2691 [Chitinophagales bacterium]